MCGIRCILRRSFLTTNPLSHRGPDAFRVTVTGKCTMEFSRLAINDLTNDGMQPFESPGSALVCNGEIYNHSSFSEDKNDCACLLPMIEFLGIMETSKRIRGVFAMCYTDGEKVLVSRDALGVRPLFYTRIGSDIAFASEMKGLLEFGTRIEIFPPGHVYDSSIDQFSCWYPCYWGPVISSDPSRIRPVFEEAVRLRIENTDRALGFLLSGGLDSSLVVAVAQKFLPGVKLKTFSVGTSVDSPDIKAARIVAKHLGTDHTEVIFTVQEGIDVLQQVIWSLESYDTTTVRASVPMWLLARWISENTDCKVILSGEGSDELFGGYLYFLGAPNVSDFSTECARRLKLIHQFDGLRADRCMAAHGLELRVPFLDKEFVEVGMTIDQGYKVSVPEKRVLRQQFGGEASVVVDELKEAKQKEASASPLLPQEILWRQKNGMSDAVGYNWVDGIKEYTGSLITDEQFRAIQIAHCAPQTREEAVYRQIFSSMFGPNDHVISEIWRPRWTTVTDPSARQLPVFSS